MRANRFMILNPSWLIVAVAVVSGCAGMHESPVVPAVVQSSTAPAQVAATQPASAFDVIAAHDWVYDQAGTLAASKLPPAELEAFRRNTRVFVASFRDSTFQTRDVADGYTRRDRFVAIRSNERVAVLQIFLEDGTPARDMRLELDGDNLRMVLPSDAVIVFRKIVRGSM